MCCELCSQFEDCEQALGGPDYCCPRCSEFEDCPTRFEMDYVGLGEEEAVEDYELWPLEE